MKKSDKPTKKPARKTLIGKPIKGVALDELAMKREQKPPLTARPAKRETIPAEAFVSKKKPK